MNEFQRDIINEDGTEETLLVTSKDSYRVKMSENYVLANNTPKKMNPLVKKFKGSILGADIGVKSAGFSNIAILATIIALGTFCVMYFLWRF